MAEVLTELSSALAGAVSRAAGGVARVEARERFPASGIVWSKDGVVVTANHVVERDDELRVGVGEDSLPAVLIGRDPATDIAVLRVEGADFEPLVWADAAQLEVGHITLALGRPGRTVRATMGIASAIGGAWRSHAGGRLERYLQADVAMHPGFSGGPLIDATGAALGMNTSALRRMASPTVPAGDVKRVTEALLADGKVRRGYLGITPQPARLPGALAEQLGQDTGLLITLVEPGSPADKGKLLLGDVIVRIDDTPVRQLDDLFSSLADRAGETAQVQAVRGGQVQTFSLTIGERG